GTTTGGSKETCGGSQSCGASRSYVQCVTQGTPCATRFSTSDGQSFACASCTDCSAASQLLSAWCAGNSAAACAAQAPGSACGLGGDEVHPAGRTELINELRQCECASNGEGSCASMCTTFCQGGDYDNTCGTCMQNDINIGVCDTSAQCSAISQCNALLNCY